MDFLSISDNLTELYIYKLKTNKKDINLEVNSINFIRLEFLGKYEASITARSKQSLLNLDNKVLKLGLNDSMNLAISDEFEFEENTFYFLSEQAIENDEELANAYYFETKIDELIFNDLGNDKIQEFTITKLKAFKELNDVEFVLLKNENFENYELEFKSSSLINQILNFKNGFFEVPNFEIKENKKPILLFANPTAIYENNYSLFLWSLSKFYIENWSTLYNQIRELSTSENNQYYLSQITTNEEYKNIIKQCAYNTYVEYQGSEQQRKEWTAKNGNSKSADINDYIIRNFIASKSEIEKIKFLSILLIFSENIASSYSWKGGLNDEHKAVLPVTARFKNISGQKDEPNPNIILETFFFNFEKQNSELIFGVYNQFLNKNIFILNGKMVQFGITPEVFEDLDISQQPIDFNNKTLNLNYPFYLFATNEETKKLFNLNNEILDNYDTQIFTVEKQTQEPDGRGFTRPRNWYQETINEYKGRFPFSEINIEILRTYTKPVMLPNHTGLGATETRDLYHNELRVTVKTYNNSNQSENTSLFLISNPSELRAKLLTDATRINIQTKPEKIIIKGAFLQDYKVIINEQSYLINSKNKITNKLIFWD